MEEPAIDTTRLRRKSSSHTIAEPPRHDRHDSVSFSATKQISEVELLPAAVETSPSLGRSISNNAKMAMKDYLENCETSICQITWPEGPIWEDLGALPMLPGTIKVLVIRGLEKVFRNRIPRQGENSVFWICSMVKKLQQLDELRLEKWRVKENDINNLRTWLIYTKLTFIEETNVEDA